MMKKIIIILLCIISNPVFAALSPIEKKIKTNIINSQSAQIKLLKKLVLINSGTSNEKGIHQVGQIVKQELQKLGFKTYWTKVPSSMHRSGALVAEHRGSSGKHLLLIAHLDTVFSKNSKPHFAQHKNSAKGQGVIDDKGGLVVLLYALKSLYAEGLLKDKSITVVLVGDEEDSGKPTTISRQFLINLAKKSDIALDFEPAISLDTATIARRGVSHWSLVIQGKESHSAAIFQKEVGAGAIFEAARVLNTLRTNFPNELGLSFNPGLIAGGTKVELMTSGNEASVFGKQNVIAKMALVTGDFRFIDAAQQQLFETELKRIANTALPGTRTKLSFQAGIPAMSATEGNANLLKKYSQVSEDLGQGTVKPLPATLRGAGDISYIAGIVPANLSGLGALGWGAHSAMESIELSSLPIQTERAAIFIHRLS